MKGTLLWGGIALPIESVRLHEGAFITNTATVDIPDSWTGEPVYTILGEDGLPIISGTTQPNNGIRPGDTLAVTLYHYVPSRLTDDLVDGVEYVHDRFVERARPRRWWRHLLDICRRV